MKISVWHRELSDSYLRFVTQLGADCLDFGTDTDFPGVAEQGYPDLDELLKMKKKIQSWGLSINRISLPNITEKFMTDQPGGEKELENTCRHCAYLPKQACPLPDSDSGATPLTNSCFATGLNTAADTSREAKVRH